MQSHDTATAHGLAPAEPVRRRRDVAELEAACRRQADVIDRLTSALMTLRRGYAALKAENGDLRAAAERPRRTPGQTEVRLPLDARAAGAARLVVAQCLADRVPAPTLDNAMLVMSELVTNSVRHSHQPAERGIVIRVQVSPPVFRLEVQDGGHDGVIAPRTPDPVAGSGYGLAVVERLSERWGLERSVDTGTRVWAQLPRGAVLS
jgi:anti-sigma regulatory factor (Ser/Thr protein kinase)